MLHFFSAKICGHLNTIIEKIMISFSKSRSYWYNKKIQLYTCFLSQFCLYSYVGVCVRADNEVCRWHVSICDAYACVMICVCEPREIPEVYKHSSSQKYMMNSCYKADSILIFSDKIIRKDKYKTQTQACFVNNVLGKQILWE